MSDMGGELNSDHSLNRRMPLWMNPRPGRIRVFIDVPFKNNFGSAGMVACNDTTQILQLCAQCFKTDSSFETELLALKFGAETCKALN
ncbi:hypothetical protein PanWU01x14_138970 [Parasponia andersonii]|uniref:RNase H type-1 domain-containing protein n=1 Tax=Parasponia andersonii TaxID=3476 RepID=A0A2P5CMW7_PARAD|nr:hypothetical protein PanWU01x14_138970 [Parasponia andersonii]